MVALLSVLLSLEFLCPELQSPQSLPDWESRSLFLPQRFILPTFNFRFKGVTDCLEHLVTRIDTPQLDEIRMTFFDQNDFDTPRLAQFINRDYRIPKFRKRDAHVQVDDDFARVRLPLGFTTLGSEIAISCRERDWQLSSIEQLCNSSLHPPSTVEDPYTDHHYWQLVWKNDAVENTLWSHLLLPFPAVKILYLSKQFAPGIAATLRELVADRILELLPSLQNIFVKGLEHSGPFQDSIGLFVAARLLSDHPITISDWDTN